MDTRLKRLYEAAYNGDVYSLHELLEEDKLLLNRVVTTTEVTDNPLHIAAYLGHDNFARNILQQKPTLAREFNAQGMSPLHLAAAEGHLRVAEELLQVDADLCSLRENKGGYLPIHIAVTKGRLDLVTLLIHKCEDLVDVVTYNSETLLHLAIKAKHSEIVEFLTARPRCVTKPMLNAQDGNGNTSLHLAFLGRQQKVIKHLLSLADIEVNSINSAGLTPLDLLLVTNHEIGDLYLGEMLRAAGGKTANELGGAETIMIHSTSTDGPQTSVRRFSWSAKTNEGYDSIGNLMVVATLVATVTFTAALNPPGGSIQMPFEDKDRMNATYLDNWKNMTTLYPAGSPVYLWQLKRFYIYDSLALLTSVTVMLLCLSGIARYVLARKFMVIILWISIFFMVAAFISALKILFYTEQNIGKFKWFKRVDIVWNIFFTLAIAALIGHPISLATEGEYYPFLVSAKSKLGSKLFNTFLWILNLVISFLVGFVMSILFPSSLTDIYNK